MELYGHCPKCGSLAGLCGCKSTRATTVETTEQQSLLTPDGTQTSTGCEARGHVWNNYNAEYKLECVVCGAKPTEPAALPDSREEFDPNDISKDVRNGFICGAWKMLRQSDGLYVMRCDRPHGHKGYHVDKVLLTNWDGPTPKENADTEQASHTRVDEALRIVDEADRFDDSKWNNIDGRWAYSATLDAIKSALNGAK